MAFLMVGLFHNPFLFNNLICFLLLLSASFHSQFFVTKHLLIGGSLGLVLAVLTASLAVSSFLYGDRLGLVLHLGCVVNEHLQSVRMVEERAKAGVKALGAQNV